MKIQIKTYEEFANERKKYDGSYKCFVNWCDKPAYYEGGDARCYCGMCEEHFGLKEYYISYLKYLEKKVRIRMLWDKNDTTLESIYETIINKLTEVNDG